MKRRRIATVTLVATTAAMLPAAASIAADTGGGSSVLVGSGRVITGPTQSKLLRQGDAPGATAMSLSLLVPLPNQAQAQALAAKGVVLSPAEYTKRFGASQAAVDKASAWAKANGYRVTYVSRDSGQVFVTSTVAKVNKSLSVRIQRASLDSVSGLAPNTDPTIANSSGVIAVAGLSTLSKKEPLNARGLNATRSSLRTAAASKVAPKANGATDGSTNCADYWGDHLYPKAKKYGVMSNALCGYIPQDLQKIYGSAGVAAQKPTLGILLWGNDKSMLAQTNAYMKEVGFPQLAAANYKVFSSGQAVPAVCDPKGVNVEQALDVQSTHAIAPNATIHYYDAGSCLDTPLTATLQKTVTAHQVSTISMSFGTGSDRGETAASKAAWDRPLLQASLTGISTFASSGDQGNNSTLPISDTEVQGYAGVGLPASSNYTTAVGGTAIGLTSKGVQTVAAGWENRYFAQANTNTTATGITDVTFTADFLPVSGAGGGQSASYAQPSWQKGKVGSYTRRAVPDVSALADPATGYTIRFIDMKGGNQAVYGSVGGTSLASPIVAAMVGLAKQKNNSKVGLAAPVFYKLAGTSAIKDINYPGKSGVFYNAHNDAGQVVPNVGYVVGLDAKPENLVSAPNWDNVTGVGTPNGAAFFAAFK